MAREAVILVYATYPSEQEAERISAVLIDERLVACANIMARHRSMFRWDGAMQETREIAVFYKTRAVLFHDLAARIAGLHTYECPCIVALPLESGFGPFLDWVVQETRSE